MPNLTLRERQWDTEFDFDTTDWEAVYAFYDADLQAQGWQKVSEDIESGDVDAEYAKDGLELDLSVDLEDGNYVEVQIDIDESASAITAGTFGLYTLPGLTINLYPDANVLQREWDYDFDYDTTDVAAVFAHYDGLLRQQGWTEVSREDEFDVTYQLNGVTFRLDVDLEDGDYVEVEISVDQNN